MNFKPIGTVKSPFTEPREQKWEDVTSEIHLDETLTEGLVGLSGFSHIYVIYHLHQAAPFDPRTDLVKRPRGRADLPLAGVFARRSPHRPNPIAVTIVRLLGVNQNILTVKGLDALDGTPVLDIKPYMPDFDRVPDAAFTDWVNQL